MMKAIIDSDLSTLSNELGVNACVLYIFLNNPINLRTTREAASLVVASDKHVVKQFKAQHCQWVSLEADKTSAPSRSATPTLDVANLMYKENMSIDITFLFAPKLTAKFVFYSNKLCITALNDKLELIKSKLLQVAIKINNSHKLIKQSLINMGVINRKTIDILQFTAVGYSRKDIAPKLNLSVRGIDYYIEIAKITFEADSLPALIYNVNQYGLLKDFSEMEAKHESQ
ncbi:helix-turn-helix transcriptional regulator [Shewanella sp. 10N.286.51.B2]|uniref:helix-turn-helix transcriptional regulator n=1 Tax=unclassified Shewanella TaxID=196818 RepID=UPI0026E34C4A|nr:hypothetical protein [Shewanella sp. 3_MG-2023]MDO6777495.1 hypothetical protein [Shewanella sp. 3_MG-2023]